MKDCNHIPVVKTEQDDRHKLTSCTFNAYVKSCSSSTQTEADNVDSFRSQVSVKIEQLHTTETNGFLHKECGWHENKLTRSQSPEDKFVLKTPCDTPREVAKNEARRTDKTTSERTVHRYNKDKPWKGPCSFVKGLASNTVKVRSNHLLRPCHSLAKHLLCSDRSSPTQRKQCTGCSKVNTKTVPKTSCTSEVSSQQSSEPATKSSSTAEDKPPRRCLPATPHVEHRLNHQQYPALSQDDGVILPSSPSSLPHSPRSSSLVSAAAVNAPDSTKSIR